MALGTQITEWRNAQVAAHGAQGLLSRLSIDGKLYDIKDPAVETLAAYVDERLSTLEGHQWTAVSKDANAGKFATSVTQAADGSISVSYSDVRATALDEGVTAGQWVTGVQQATDGQITVLRAGITGNQVGYSGTQGLSATNVTGAIDEVYAAAMALKGTQGTDAASAETIAGAKQYAKDLVDGLAGEDWSQNAKTVHDIIDELAGAQGSNAWDTVVDKLHGMGWAADSTAPDGQQGANPAPTVVEYVQHEIAKIQAKNAEGIEGLDAIVYGASSGAGDASTAQVSYDSDTTSFVKVKVTEVDGKITGVQVGTNDIAKASELTTLDGEVVKTVNGQSPTDNAVTLYAGNIALSSTDATTVGAQLTTLATNNANVSGFQTQQIREYGEPTYTAGTETVAFTSTQKTVFMPSGTGI